MLIAILFFYRYVNHRDLHSFPTRRSSDLDGHDRRAGDPELPGPAGRGPARRDVRRRPSRSEEHTSELQSRRDLVCRLLLEKKKTHTKVPLSEPTFRSTDSKSFALCPDAQS